MSKTKKRKIKLQSSDDSDIILNVDSLYKTIEDRVATVMKPIIRPMVQDIAYIKSLVNPRIIRLDDKSEEHETRLKKIEDRPFKLAPIFYYIGAMVCNVVVIYLTIKAINPGP